MTSDTILIQIGQIILIANFIMLTVMYIHLTLHLELSCMQYVAIIVLYQFFIYVQQTVIVSSLSH